MKLRFLSIGHRLPTSIQDIVHEYEKKISPFVAFEWSHLKSPSVDRSSSEIKKAKEAEIIRRKIPASAVVILFDERGQVAKNSVVFSEKLSTVISSGRQEVVFLIGGSYGVADEVRNLADQIWSLSPLTMNHHVAIHVAIEQIYRALMIWKGRSYHND